jgi:hypothetical protein
MQQKQLQDQQMHELQLQHLAGEGTFTAAIVPLSESRPYSSAIVDTAAATAAAGTSQPAGGATACDASAGDASAGDAADDEAVSSLMALLPKR